MTLLLRNWHLKLGAVALATVLYTGLVFSGSFSESTIQVPVVVTNQPGTAFVLSGDPGTVQVRYRAEADLAINVDADSFVATVDLSRYDMERAPDPQSLSVEVTALAGGVEVLTKTPASVTVQLDRLDARSVPVEVDHGQVPPGLEVDAPLVSVDEVQIRGPASQVRLVDRAVARVRIDPSGIDVERPVKLEAVDVEGQPVGDVELTPDSVAVQIGVQAVETNKTIPVRPDIGGTPAAGFALESLAIEPSIVTLRGLPEVLAGIDEVLTEPLSIAGASANQVFGAALTLPDGTRLAGAAAEATAVVTATIVPSVSSRTFVVGVVCSGEGQNACLPNLDQVSVTLSGPGGALSGLAASDLTPVLDVTGLAPGQHSVEPSLPPLPDGVELVAISPVSVPLTLRAPATPAPTPTPAP